MKVRLSLFTFILLLNKFSYCFLSGEKMIALVPSWAHNYNEFWEAIKARNLWFIKLRYAAVLMLIGFRILPELFSAVQFSPTQKSAIELITVTIFIYNILFHYSRKFLQPVPKKFNPLHLSLLQIIFDLAALTLLLYFTGDIENPLFMFYIFHMIIGSLILPGNVIFTIAALVIISFCSMIFLEYFGVLTHHHIKGLLNTHLYDEFYYIFFFAIVFTLMMFTSVFLANMIARQLYKRERQLKETLDKLNEAEIAKQKYIMGIVHEIKSPIAAVQSYLDIIMEGFVGSVSKIILDKIKKARTRTDEAVQMINNVLRISQLKQLDIIGYEAVRPEEILNKLVRRYSEKYDKKNVLVKFEDKREVKSMIEADKILLEMAFSNILGNSVKYARKNGNVEVRLSEEKNEIEIEFCDDGIGIPPEEIDQIFNQFYRASNVTDNEFEGSGLGLSLVKEIIERHEGNITVQSPSRLGDSVSPGTSFIVRLPKKYSEQKRENEPIEFQEY